VGRQKKTPPPSQTLVFRVREGLVVVCRQKKSPSVSRFERGRGGGCVDREPLRLAIQAREGLVVVCWQKKPPPSRVLSEGGVEGVLTRETPPPSRVLSEGGVGGDVSAEETPLRLAFRAREGWRWWWCVDRKTTPLRLASRVREGV